MWGLIDLVGWVINQGPRPPPSPCKPHVQKETSEIFSRWDHKKNSRPPPHWPTHGRSQKAPPPPCIACCAGGAKSPIPPLSPMAWPANQAYVCFIVSRLECLLHFSTPPGRMRQWMHVVAHGKGPRPPAPLRTQGPLCMWLRQLAGLDRSRNFGDSFFLIRKVFPEKGSGKKKEK